MSEIGRPAPPPERSTSGHMLHGSFWMILLRWTIRLTGLVSTIILARLLTPADFGIVAMAMIIVTMLEVLNQSGQKLAIIRLIEPTREHYDSAWTISMLVGFGIAIGIFVIAPFTNFYFHEPRAVTVMQCLAFRAALGGVENIGTTDFRRDLKFDVFFRYNVYPKIVSFVVTVALAFWLRNYWALVAGILTSQLTLTFLSYAMHPFRPRPSLAKVGEIWSFSVWTLVRTIGGYVSQQVDQIAIGGVAGAPSMGRYAVGADVATSPSREINDPMIAVLFPVMSRLQGDLAQLKALYLRTVGWSTIICISASVGVTLIARDMVPIVLGAKWLDVEPLMGWLALAAGIAGVSSATYTLFDALGKPRLGARMQWVRAILLVLTIFPAALLTHSLVAIATTRFFVMAVFVPTLFAAAGRTVGVSAVDYLAVLWRPFAAAAIMSIVVVSLNALFPMASAFRLVVDVAVGGATFATSLYLLWVASGRPPTAEADLLTLLKFRPRLSWVNARSQARSANRED